MTITPYKTPPVKLGTSLVDLLDAALPKIQEKEILIITSKIVAICEGRVVQHTASLDKHALIRDECQQYLAQSPQNRFDVELTITHDILIANAGIDESNGNGSLVLWPKHPQESARSIWNHIRTKHALTEVGVIITDSATRPLRWGVTGIGIAWCGFEALKNYIGTPDVFGRNLRMTRANVVDGLAAGAVITMGEGNEQTPLALIDNAPFVSFQDHPPTAKDVTAMKIDIADDLYAPFLTKATWEKGGR